MHCIQAASLVAFAVAPATLATDFEITNTGFVFTPNTLTIQQGDRVIWNINVGHSVFQTTGAGSCIELSGGFHSEKGLSCDGTINFTQTFNTPGTVHYACGCHCQLFGMRGSITILPTAEPSCDSCVGDVAGDFRVDGADVAAFVQCMIDGQLDAGRCICADMDEDDDLDADDVAIFVDRLLTSPAGC